MTDAQVRGPRGSFVLYAVSFVLLLAAGASFVGSARGFLSSTRLLWVSAGFSLLAISAAIAGLLVTRRR